MLEQQRSESGDGSSQREQARAASSETDDPTTGQLPAAAGATRINASDPLLAAKDLIEKLAEIPQSLSGFTLARPGDCRAATQALKQVLRQNKTLFQRRNEAFAKAFFKCVARLETVEQIRPYPNELLRLAILKGRALLEYREPEQALAAIRHLADRPYLVEGDAENAEALLRLKQDALLVLGSSHEASRVARFGFRKILREAPRLGPSAFRRFSPGLHLSLGIRPGTLKKQPADPAFTAVLAHWRVAMARGRGSRIALGTLYCLTKLLDYFASGTAWLWYFTRRRNKRLKPTSDSEDTSEVLVTRAMGGVGDLIMMTPGLRALAKREGKPVHFAIRQEFFSLFHGNTDVVLHDIHGSDIDVERFSRWHDLSFCPAGRHEARYRPHVRKGRVELFAAGMGVTAQELEASGDQPVLKLRPDSIERAASFFARHGLDESAAVLAVHAFSRDTYKDYPRMPALITRLAVKFKVMVFHHVAFPLPEHPNIIPAFGQSLADAIATFARCRLAICADSAFLHIAAALQIPTIALFGPTDGELFTRHHPRVHVISMKGEFKCIPCWRNEDTPCPLNGGRESVCMASIREERIVTLAENILGSPIPTVSH